MNCTLRACKCGAIGTHCLSGIPLDYCGAHERIARALPALRERTATKCANSACESAPVKTAIFCNTCRKRYHAWGVTQYPKESAVSEAVAPPADGEVAAHLSAIAKIEQDFRTRRDAAAARLEAMGASVYGYTYEIMYTVGSVRVALPRDDKGVAVEDYARQVEQAEEALAGLEAAKAEPHPLETRRDALVERLKAAGFEEQKQRNSVLRHFTGHGRSVLVPIGHPCEVEREFEGCLAVGEATVAEVEAAKAEPDPAEPSAGDVADAQEAGSVVALDEVAQLRAQRDEAEAKLSAIADMLNEDEERSPSFGADDEPIPLVDRVRVALMPDGFGQSAWERRLTRELDRCGAPEGFSPYLRTALIAQALKDERERTKEQAQEIYDAGRVLTILGAPPHLPLREALMRVLSPEDRRAVLEVEAAEARAALARVKARRVDPATPQQVAEYEARAAAAQAALGDLPAELEED